MCNYLRIDTYAKRYWKARLFGCKICDTDIDTVDEFQDSECVARKKDMLENTRSKIEIADNYGTGYDITKEGNEAILNTNRREISEPQIADIVGIVTYTKDGSGAKLRSKFSGSTKVLNNSALDGYSSVGSEPFETIEVELDFTPPSVRGSRRLESNGGSISEALLQSITSAVDITESLVNNTVNMHMTGINPRVKQFTGKELKPLTLALQANDMESAVFCSDLPATFLCKPYIGSYDPDCGSLTYLTSSTALTNMRLHGLSGASPNVPDTYTCGTVKVTRRWTVKDKCENTGGGICQSAVDQIIYMKLIAPIWTNVPWAEPVSLSAS